MGREKVQSDVIACKVTLSPQRITVQLHRLARGIEAIALPWDLVGVDYAVAGADAAGVGGVEVIGPADEAGPGVDFAEGVVAAAEHLGEGEDAVFAETRT